MAILSREKMQNCIIFILDHFFTLAVSYTAKYSPRYYNYNFNF